MTAILFSIIFVFFVVSSPSFAQNPQLTITEVSVDPKAVGDSDGEWFEIYNPSDQAVSLKNLVIKDEGKDSHTVESDLTINPKSYIVFCKNNNSEQNGGVNCAYQYSKFSLANESDEIILELHGEIARLVYSKSTHPVKSGKSMELDGSSWHESTNQFGKGDYGTPGSGNSAAATSTPIPQPTATDAPKPTKVPTATVKPTEVEKVQAQVLGDEDEEVPEIEPTDSELAQQTEIENSVVSSEQISSPTPEEKGTSNVGNYFVWGGVLSMMGAIGSFLWITNKGPNN